MRKLIILALLGYAWKRFATSKSAHQITSLNSAPPSQI